MSAGYDGNIIVWDVSFHFSISVLLYFIYFNLFFSVCMALLNDFLVIVDLGRQTNLEI